MREILFKAKLKDWKTNPQQNKWVEGYYLRKKETTYCFAEDYEKFPVKTLHYIAVDSMTDWGLPNEFRCYEIDLDTLCELTEFKDVSNRRIWENDILKCYKYNHGYSIVTNEVVQNTKGHFRTKTNSDLSFSSSRQHVKLLGNIFDNPELLKEGR